MSDSMRIPDAALQQHVAVLGKTGSGKTFAIKGIVERLLREGRRVCIVDPTGAWWGLRSSADGSRAGYPILVLGGDHGDLPLPALGGAAIARLVAERGTSLIADTSLFTVGERTRWFAEFAGALYRLNRAPLYLVLDEAHNFAPQGKVPDPDTGKMLHAANALASGGRSRGIRLTMITQRPQKLHKDTLTSADTLIAMRVLAPHDRAAVKDWIEGCGDLGKGKEILNSIAGLRRGEGWVWYPEGNFLRKIRFPAIETFDSSATPTDAEHAAAPSGAAKIDLTELKELLADAVREAEENDPKALREKILKLQRQVEAAPAAAVDPEAIRKAFGDGIKAGQISLTAAVGKLSECARILNSCVAEMEERISLKLFSLSADFVAPPHPGEVHARKPLYSKVEAHAGNGKLPRAERLILSALAQYPRGRSRTQIAILAGYAVKGGGFSNAVGALRSSGAISGDSSCLKITDEGQTLLGDFVPLPRGRALLDHWLGQLPKAERKALEALAEVYPGTLSKSQLANRAGYQAGGGGFLNALGRLRTLELIAGSREIRASEEFFGE